MSADSQVFHAQVKYTNMSFGVMKYFHLDTWQTILFNVICHLYNAVQRWTQIPKCEIQTI